MLDQADQLITLNFEPRMIKVLGQILAAAGYGIVALFNLELDEQKRIEIDAIDFCLCH